MRIRFIFVGLTLAAMLSAPTFAQEPAAERKQEKKERRGRGPWFSAGPGGHRVAGDWLRKYKSMPPQEQEKALTDDPKFKELPPERQQELRERLQRFNALPPEQKDRIVERMTWFEQMTPEQRQRWRKLQAEMHGLPHDRQRAVRHAFRRLRGVAPGNREEAMKAEQERHKLTENEQRLLKEMLAGADEFRQHAPPDAEPPL